MQQLIDADMEVLEKLGAEIVAYCENGTFHLSDWSDMRDKLKAACDAHYASEMKYHEALRDLIAETAKRIDAKVSP